MDAHLFRRVCAALVPELMGARLEKIHAPGQNLTVFTLHGGAGRGKRFLALAAGRTAPLLFLSPHRLPSGAPPPAFVMRLRKYLADRRIERAQCHWVDRRLYLGFAGEIWLCLSLREGPSLSFEAPPQPREALWPQDLSALAPDAWRAFPVLTPALRRTLPFLEPLDAAALLADLEAGGGDVFLYQGEDGRYEVSAWPLPPGQLAAMPGSWKETVCTNPLDAMAKAGETLQIERAAEARAAASRPLAAELARLDRLEKKLDAEETRLCTMRDKQGEALAIQSRLYLFGANERRASLTLNPEGESANAAPGEVCITLNPRRTIRENMADLFHQAERGRRGLAHLALRREALKRERERLCAAMELHAAVAKPQAPEKMPPHGAGRDDPASPLRQIQCFRSSDGFVILRGKSAKGNALALKLAAPHDYWLHAADGPGAHVIIRRDHPAQDVPERTLHEAGALAGLKSWQNGQAHAHIQYALAKFVHPMKNAAPGMVRLERGALSFSVALNPELETTLAKA